MVAVPLMKLASASITPSIAFADRTTCASVSGQPHPGTFSSTVLTAASTGWLAINPTNRHASKTNKNFLCLLIVPSFAQFRYKLTPDFLESRKN
jgi:hypothetical protein